MKFIEEIRQEAGKKASYARKMEELTVAEAAAKAGISAPTVRKIESGDSGVSLDNYLKLAHALHCLPSFSKLFDYEVDLFKEAEIEQRSKSL